MYPKIFSGKAYKRRRLSAFRLLQSIKKPLSPHLTRCTAAAFIYLLSIGTGCDRGPGETHPGPAFISGMVYEDLDGDGEQDENEYGVGGVLIQAEEAGSRGGGFSNSTVSDGDGYYSIELAGSHYTVFVDREELTEMFVQTSKPESYELTLPDGREVSSLDFGLQQR